MKHTAMKHHNTTALRYSVRALRSGLATPACDMTIPEMSRSRTPDTAALISNLRFVLT